MKSTILITAVFGAASLSGCQAVTSSSVDSLPPVCGDYTADQIVAVLGESPELAGEWYGDWAYFLNQFAEQNPQIRIVSGADAAAFNLAPYTLILTRQSKGEYRLKEVLDPPYYDYAVARLRGDDIKGILRHFELEPVTPSQVDIVCKNRVKQ
ncbi:hypothetical protein F0267_04445 [Vibrio coralliilyticus]|uniref:Uncharacterized protein n=1 Tax=Vibrio coralliilyticus TaxID=190893 RepID=A0AAN0SHQ1_9VIBR|nr:hypothetical protein [Vibrio coralliilyticus]AIW22276.1 hypothetical protein IX92_24430 [Vibrio coralliilyticus]NOH37478.1 hypothetical protein [Vibrio coralliilyticus]